MFENDDGLVILSQPEPQMCGGTYATQNTNAPTAIESQRIVYFDVKTALGGMVCVNPAMQQPLRFNYVSAFAVPTADGGSFLCLHTRPVNAYNEPDRIAFALVKEDVFPALDRLVRAHDLAKRNGSHSYTNGLPQNFGGNVDIEYESGEAISFSNNQSPILSPVAANEIADFFEKALGGEKIPLPPIDALKEIRFCESRENGGFSRATLTLESDGTGTNRKEQCFDPGQVYRSEKAVDEQTVTAIKRTVANCGMFAWEKLPRSRCVIDGEKTITFVFDDSSEITVTNHKALPMTLSGGFFGIELEMITKH